MEILYLHAPDHNTPLETTLRVMDSLHKEGKFKQLGLSNYSSWLVTEVVNICKVYHKHQLRCQTTVSEQANNWVRPSVYQGMYSVVTRQVTTNQKPVLGHMTMIWPITGGGGTHSLSPISRPGLLRVFSARRRSAEWKIPVWSTGWKEDSQGKIQWRSLGQGLQRQILENWALSSDGEFERFIC